MPRQFTIIYKRGCDELEEVENPHIAGLRCTQLHKFMCYNRFDLVSKQFLGFVFQVQKIKQFLSL